MQPPLHPGCSLPSGGLALLTPSEWPEACQVYPTPGSLTGAGVPEVLRGRSLEGLLGSGATCGLGLASLCVGSESSNVG